MLLSERYVTDRYLPDKAIDLLDEACACASLANNGRRAFTTQTKSLPSITTNWKSLKATLNTPTMKNRQW
ncbi:MAG: hypothetical protein ACLR56_08445 [Oscillospiraceae bacterium]